MTIDKRVEELRYNTLTNIENIQRAKVPVIYDLQIERKYSFDTHGFFHSAYNDSWLLYTCRNLPFSVNLKRHVFSDSLTNMVNNKEIQPFLLFIDHKLVKWSDITIIKDCNFSYILITNNTNLYNPICECILLPEKIKYSENINDISDKTIFSFNNNGLLVEKTDGAVATIVNLEDQDIFFSGYQLTEAKKQQSNIDPKFKITKSNFIFFKDGYLEITNNLDIHGLNVYSLNNNTFFGSKYSCREFYYTKSNLAIDNINNPYNINKMINRLKREDIPDYIFELSKDFDFKFDNNKSYDKNIEQALLYIMGYNSNLMNDIYKKASNITTRLYSGKEINSIKNEKGYVTMSRRIGDCPNNYPIIFHNGELYKYYNEIKYKNKNFIFPALDILDSDDIEIIFFKNIDNRSFPLYLPSGEDNIVNFDSSIDLANYKLYTINPEHQLYNIERTIRTQYEVPFTFDIKENKYHIKLGDSYYYDRNLTLVSDRQFRYMSKVATEDLIDIMLPSDFYYCTNRNKYMVFIDGRKIDNDNFIITLPNTQRPFDDISIYLNIPISKGQRIDVFYVPEQLDELYIAPDVSNTGIIVIDRDKLSYGLDNDLYFIFINGRKLNANQMYNMNSGRLKITTDLKSIKNLCIIKHISDNNILSELFKSMDSILDRTYDYIPDFELSDIFFTENTYKNTEIDIKSNKVSTDRILYHIIQDYYMRPYINTGDIIDYEFMEFESALEKDSENNAIISTMDATKEDKLG